MSYTNYTIKLIDIFNPEIWMVDKNVKNFLRKREKGDLVLLIDDKVPNLAPLLTIFRGHDKKQPWEFIGENPVHLLAPRIEYDGLSKIITPRIKNLEEEISNINERKIVYIPDRLYCGTEAVDALRNEEGPNMKEFRIYAELIEKDMMKKIAELDWDYSYNLWRKFQQT